MKIHEWFDRFTVSCVRSTAQRTSRRSLLAKFGATLVGAAGLPLLPIARGAQAAENAGGGNVDDPTSCDYWRYCAIDGFLCSCCGGSETACPAGTEKSPVTWVGTCMNPHDGKAYIISYNDCCGTNSCGRCFCHTNEGDTPVYMPSKSNDINWCLGTSNIAYHCSLAVVLGISIEDSKAG